MSDLGLNTVRYNKYVAIKLVAVVYDAPAH